METHAITTPFGRRSVSLALVKGQMETAEIRTGKVADKWKVFRDISEARAKLGLQDRSLAVLHALLSFYPETELSEEKGLIVFPSNEQLSLRAHGIAGTTLRRHLGALVEAGLIHRKDSPNGKRYARRETGGAIEQAFGFNLAPLLARREEIAMLAQTVAAERKALLEMRERLTICRRDIRKLISAALEEGLSGNWGFVESQYVALVARLPRKADPITLADLLDDFELLRAEVVNRLEILVKSTKIDANAIQNGDHIQNSNTESITELEPAYDRKQGAMAVIAGSADADSTDAAKQEPVPLGTNRPSAANVAIKPLPLPMVLRACPDIVNYGPGGEILSWRDLMAAAVVTRSMLGISPSAYQEACEVLGPEAAAIVIACILERAGQINSAGGYLRNLTRRARQGEFSLPPMVMALLRAQGGEGRKVG
ncbi:replication initiation protein RepC [Rhizobium sp. RU35A]|uniref:plasmid replication protein RepC n=1 Tax=Rhizobium sp. RU35A TaxID=1907414 RepID=UPI0009556B3E|nr:plasmid replication protein RepC [Rhizobium sp. RU35A]SIQ89667.1 replication initiation protein RepC [Rhizobium sp. RU35A]